MVGGGWKEASGNEKHVFSCLFKILVAGSEKNGKSSLIARYTSDRFSEEYVTTIGVDFAVKTVQSPSGEKVKLQIWDTAGAERFRTITNSYYRGAHGAMIVLDVTDSESYESIDRWLNEVERFTVADIAVMIIATKTDKIEERCVTDADLRKLTERTGFVVVETSSKDGTGVNKAFETLLDLMIGKHMERRAAASKDGTLKDVDNLKKKFNTTEKNNKEVEDKTNTTDSGNKEAAAKKSKSVKASKTCLIL